MAATGAVLARRPHAVAAAFADDDADDAGTAVAAIDALVASAMAAADEGRWAECISKLEGVVRVRESDALMWDMLAQAQMQADGEEADAAATAADTPAGGLPRQSLLFRAIRSAERACSLAPARHDVWLTLGRAQLQYGEVHLAAEALSTARRLVVEAHAPASAGMAATDTSGRATSSSGAPRGVDAAAASMHEDDLLAAIDADLADANRLVAALERHGLGRIRLLHGTGLALASSSAAAAAAGGGGSSSTCGHDHHAHMHAASADASAASAPSATTAAAVAGGAATGGAGSAP